MQIYNYENLEAGKNCFYSAFANLMLLNGIKYPEYYYYFLSNGLDCKMELYFDHDWDSVIEFTPYKELIHRLEEKLYLNFVINELNQFRDNLQLCLSQGIAVILCMNAQSLKYHPLIIENLFYVHFVLVTDINIEENVVYIIDTFVLESTGAVGRYMGWYDLNEIQSGCILYGYVKEVPKPLCDIDIKRHVISTLNSYCNKNSDTSQVYGSIALRKAVNWLSNDKILYKNKDKYLSIIMLLKTRLISIFDYLQDYALINNKVAKYNTKLYELKKKWESLFVLLMMAFFKNEWNYMENTLNHIHDHIGYQDEVINQLLNQLMAL